MLSGMYAAAIAWAREHLDHTVDDVVPIMGGMTSAMLALRDKTGVAAVLRLITEEPWRTHGRDLVTRESVTQCTLASTGVPAPLSLATDPDGEATGHPAHLMTLVPGSPETRCDDGSLAAIAGLLASIHRVDATPPPRDFQSWAWPAKWLVPAWAGRPALWQSAFELVAEDPAWLDVAHCSTNLALRHGSPVGQRFASAYTRLTGVQRDPYWEVMDVVGFLPPPGREPMFDDPTQLARLEEHLAWAIGP